MILERTSEFIREYLFIPFAHASSPKNVTELIGRINKHVINPVILVLFALAFVQFTLGLFKFFQAKAGKSSDEDLETGKRHILWGVIGMAIMVSVFGIISFFMTNLGLQGGADQIKKGGTGDVSVYFQN